MYISMYLCLCQLVQWYQHTESQMFRQNGLSESERLAIRWTGDPCIIGALIEFKQSRSSLSLGSRSDAWATSKLCHIHLKQKSITRNYQKTWMDIQHWDLSRRSVDEDCFEWWRTTNLGVTYKFFHGNDYKTKHQWNICDSAVEALFFGQVDKRRIKVEFGSWNLMPWSSADLVSGSPLLPTTWNANRTNSTNQSTVMLRNTPERKSLTCRAAPDISTRTCGLKLAKSSRSWSWEKPAKQWNQSDKSQRLKRHTTAVNRGGYPEFPNHPFRKCE